MPQTYDIHVYIKDVCFNMFSALLNISDNDYVFVLHKVSLLKGAIFNVHYHVCPTVNILPLKMKGMIFFNLFFFLVLSFIIKVLLNFIKNVFPVRA